MRASGKRNGRGEGGFTLVMTLSILAAVTILVVGLFSIVSRERRTSTAFDAVQQAELAAQAGLEQAGVLLKEALRDENGIIMAVPTAPWISEEEVAGDPQGRLRSEAGREGSEVLMAVNFAAAEGGVGGGGWVYRPLVSGARGSEVVNGVPADPVLAELRQVTRPAVPGTVQGGMATYQVLPQGAAAATMEEMRELKRARQQAGREEPWKRSGAAYWVELTRPLASGEEAGGEAGEVIAGRFCFHVEDLQGRVNLATAGNTLAAIPGGVADGIYERSQMRVASANGAGVHAVPGLNLAYPERPRLNQVSVHTLLMPGQEPMGAPERLLAAHRQLVRLQGLQITPGMWREALLVADPESGWQPFEAEQLERRVMTEAEAVNGAAAGSLADATGRALEQHATAGWTGYDERALIPHDPGIQGGGQPKLNLNDVLAVLEEESRGGGKEAFEAGMRAVNRIAEHMEAHLPAFAGRKGGYPLPLNGNDDRLRQRGYLRCLAAGIIDYADTDSLPTMDGNPLADPLTKSVDPDGGGLAADERYPSYRGMDAYPVVSEQWQRYRFEGSGAGQAQLSVTQSVELWNMTNQRVTGEVSAVYECEMSVTVGFSSPVSLGTPPATATAVRRNFLPDLRRHDPDGNLRGYWHVPQAVTLEPNEVRVVSFAPVVFDLPAGGTVSSITVRGNDASDSDVRSRYRVAFQPAGAGGFVVVDQPLQPVERYLRTVRSSSQPRQLFNTSLPGMSGALQNRNFVNNVGDPRIAFFVNYPQDVVNYENGSSPWSRNVRSNIAERFYGENRVHLWPDGGHSGVARTSGPGSTERNPGDVSMRPGVNAGNSEAERQKHAQVIANGGRLQSVTELGHVFDPMMWDANGGSEFDEPNYRQFGNLRTGGVVRASDKFGGGNTLRIGRPEHDRFRADFSAFPAAGRPVTRHLSATALLDLFHCGVPESADAGRQRGPLVRVEGQINLNTATREALRAMVAGRLVMDPQLKRKSQDREPQLNAPVELQPPSSRDFPDGTGLAAQADLLADLIIRNRPYVSAAELPEKVILPTAAELGQRPYPRGMEYAAGEGRRYVEGQPVLGAVTRGSNDRQIEPEWNDAAAEEAFARLYNSGTVRSRNFKVVVTGQAVRKTRSGEVKVLATRSRLYHVFVRPVRDASGALVRQQLEITYARTL